MVGRLDGKVALVTGATRGLGAAVARLFAAEGAHLVLVGRTVGGLEEIDDAVRAAGGTATLVPLDLTRHDSIDEMAASLAQRFGRLDILIGNAAMLGRIGPMGHLEPKTWQAVMDLNLTANWRLIRAFEPLLRAAPAGRAVFTTCTVGREPTAFWSGYAISKAALEMMIATWAAELDMTRIKASVIDPGPLRTKLRDAAFPAEDAMRIPLPETAAPLFLERVLA